MNIFFPDIYQSTFLGDEGGLESLGISSIDVTQPRVALQVIFIINTFHENNAS